MRVTIGGKLFIGFVMLLILMIIISVAAYISLDKVGKSGDVILRHSQELNAADRLKFILLEALMINDYFITGDIQKKIHFDELSRDVEEVIQDVEPLFHTEEEQRFVMRIKEQFGVIKEKSDEIVKFADSGKKEFVGTRINKIVNEIDIAALIIVESIEDLYDAVKEELAEITKMANRTKLIAIQIIIVISIIAVIFGIMAMFMLTHWIAKPIRTLTAATKNIAKGNLTKKINVKSNDEIGDLSNSFNEMVQELKKSKEEITASNQQLKAAIEQLTANKQQLKELNKGLEQKVQERMKELQEKTDRLQRFKNLTVGRELAMIKLKEEINLLLEQLGQSKKFEAPEILRSKEDS